MSAPPPKNYTAPRFTRIVSILLLSVVCAAVFGTNSAWAQVTVSADNVTETKATLSLSGHSGWWHYKETAPNSGTCAAVTGGQSVELEGLSQGEDYSYDIFNGTSCATENKIGDVDFSTIKFDVDVDTRTRTTAMLTLENYASGTEWWYRRSWPNSGLCTSGGTGTSVTLSDLIKNTSYTYRAYDASNCSTNNEIGVVYFKTLPEHVLEASNITQTQATLELVDVNITWYYKKTQGPGASSCIQVPQGTTTVSLADLTANTSYEYRSFRAGECSSSTEIDFVSFTTLPLIPAKPASISLTAQIEAVDVSWTAGSGGGTPTGWQYTKKVGNGNWSEYADVPGSDGSTRSHTFPGTAGNQVKFKVRGVNTGGDGTESDESSAVTILTKPEIILTISPTTIAEDASATSITVKAEFSSTDTFTSNKTVTISVGGSGTATSGTDYAAVSDFDITITAGQSRSMGTFTLTPTQDTDLEGDETIGLAGSATGLTVNPTTLTLSDDDAATVTINDATSEEGESMTFTVTLDRAVSGGLTVTPSYTNGTASSSDYTQNTTALNFTGTANETKTFTISTRKIRLLRVARHLPSA